MGTIIRNSNGITIGTRDRVVIGAQRESDIITIAELTWLEDLLKVMIALRNAISEESHMSPTQAVFLTNLRYIFAFHLDLYWFDLSITLQVEDSWVAEISVLVGYHTTKNLVKEKYGQIIYSGGQDSYVL